MTSAGGGRFRGRRGERRTDKFRVCEAKLSDPTVNPVSPMLPQLTPPLPAVTLQRIHRYSENRNHVPMAARQQPSHLLSSPLGQLEDTSV